MTFLSTLPTPALPSASVAFGRALSCSTAISPSTTPSHPPPCTRSPARSYTPPSYLNFGRTVAIPDQGITFIASFAFTGVVPGTWERVFDFGSGPDTGNFGLARIGNSNDLLFFANHGGPYTSHVQANNYIRTGKLIVAVCTHRAGITKLYLDGKLVGQSSAKRKPGVVPFSQSFLGRSNWSPDAFLNGQIFYFQQVNWEVSNDHQRAIYNALRRASNSVVGYQPPPPPGPPPAPPAALELRDAPLPCGNNLLANEGLTNEEGTARLIMQGDRRSLPLKCLLRVQQQRQRLISVVCFTRARPHTLTRSRSRRQPRALQQERQGFVGVRY